MFRSVDPVSSAEQSNQSIQKNLLINISEDMKYIYGCIFIRVSGGVQIITHNSIEIKEKQQQPFSLDITYITPELRYSIRAYRDDGKGNCILIKEIQGKAVDLLRFEENEAITLTPVMQ